MIALSTKSNCIIVFKTVKETLWIKRLMCELHNQDVLHKISIYSDSQDILYLSKKYVHCEQTKHIRMWDFISSMMWWSNN